MVMHGTYRRAGLRKFLFPLGFLFLFAGLGATLFLLNRNSHTDIYCGAEKVVEEDGKLYFKSDGKFFRNGHTQTDSVARTGDHAALLQGNNYFGPAITLRVTGGQDLVARVWKKNIGTGYAAIVAQGDWGFYASQSIVFQTDEEGWEQIGVRVRVPSEVRFSKLNFYCWLVPDHKGAALFDDMTVVEAADSLDRILPVANEPHLSSEDSARYAIMPVPGCPVRAHLESQTSRQTRLKVHSFSGAEVRVKGIGSKNQLILTPPRGEAVFPPFDRKKRVPEFREMVFDGEGDYLYFVVEGLDSTFKEAITPWPVPQQRRVPSQRLFDGLRPETNALYEVKDSLVRFRKGDFSVSEPLIFPEGFRIRFPAGCRLDFRDSAYFLSRSPVEVLGSPDDPVQFLSSDRSARGFTVLQAGTSRIRNLVVSHFGTMEVDGWNLTGALTFYETRMDIDGLRIAYNHCEDGLNIVRSEVDVSGLEVESCFGDAFDCDFCEGVIHGVKIMNSGNDGLDFSGSRLRIEDAEIYAPGDKGISVGEESSVELLNYRLEGGNIGLASKDLSEVHAEKVSMSGLSIGFTAYRKKPEFGAARIRVDSYQGSDVKTLHAIEEGSELLLEGQKVLSR